MWLYLEGVLRGNIITIHKHKPNEDMIKLSYVSSTSRPFFRLQRKLRSLVFSKTFLSVALLGGSAARKDNDIITNKNVFMDIAS